MQEGMVHQDKEAMHNLLEKCKGFETKMREKDE